MKEDIDKQKDIENSIASSNTFGTKISAVLGFLFGLVISAALWWGFVNFRIWLFRENIDIPYFLVLHIAIGVIFILPISGIIAGVIGAIISRKICLAKHVTDNQIRMLL